MTTPVETLQPPENRFNQALNNLAVDLPEISMHRDAIEKGGHELIATFAINQEFFEDKAHVLFFSALAQRNGILVAAGEAANLVERDFIHSATALLVRKRSGKYESLRSSIASDSMEVSDEAVRRAYDRHTDKQLTAELQAAIVNGLLDDVKEKAGITAENEDPYELHVLAIGNNNNIFSGMHLPRPETNDEAELAAWRDHIRTLDGYQAMLFSNTAEFCKATGMSEVPPAWVVTVNGKKLLNVPLPIAEKLLHPEALGLSSTDPGRRTDLGVLGHEYIHTQGGLNLDNSFGYGISFEERRAEFYSGENTGYEDAKAMTFSLAAMKIVNLYKYFGETPKGGTAFDLYSDIAKEAGLQAALELALTVPASYKGRAGAYGATTQTFLGDQKDVLGRIYQRRLADPVKVAMMDAATNYFVEAALREGEGHPGDVDQYLDMMRNSGAGPVIDALAKELLSRRSERR